LDIVFSTLNIIKEIPKESLKQWTYNTHTINASTFSAMVTASTLANPFASVSAAVGTLAGSLHGGANEDVLNMLDEIGEVYLD
jgi:citrate synthase